MNHTVKANLIIIESSIYMKSNIEFSSCFEQNNSFIVKKIHDSDKKDDRVPEFFQLLKFLDKDSSTALYKKAKNKDDIAIINECDPYPEQVKEAIRSSKYRVELGTLIPIEHYSCTVDNELYLWPMENATSGAKNKENNQDTSVTIIKEKCKLITCVCCGPSCQTVNTERVTNNVVVATDNSIIIYPVLNRKNILVKNSIRTTFYTCIATSMAISDKGLIFIGSDTGNIFLVTYRLSIFDMTECYIVVHNLTNYPVARYAHRLIPTYFLSNIIQLSLCSLEDESIYIASLDTKSRILFYHFKSDNHKLVEISRFKYEKKMKPQLKKIIKISSVPISDSLLTRFIAFTIDGDRIFFNTEYKNEKKEINIYPDQIRYIPDFFSKDDLVDANYSLGVTCFMYRKRFIMTQTTQNAHKADVNPIEMYTAYDIPTNGLVFSRGSHIFSNHPFHIFNNEMLWQHLVNSSPGYLLTSSGIIVINFSLPVDRLSRILNESHGNYTGKVDTWMRDFGRGSESSACTLLLASRRNQRERSSELFVLYSYTNQINIEIEKSLTQENQNDKWSSFYKKNEFNVSYELPESCKAFIIRAARLMKPIWGENIFTLVKGKAKDQDRYRINAIYDQLPDTFLTSLKTLIELAKEYLHIKSIKQTKEEGIQLHETARLKEFINYMNTVIETVNFIQILNDQQKLDNFALITDAMNKIEKQYQHILINESFGKSNENNNQQTENSLFNSLYEFAAALFRTRDDLQSLQQRFFDECPDFYNEADSRIFDELNRICKDDINKSAEQKQILINASKVFVQYAYRPLRLRKICEAFEKGHFYKGIVDVCIERALNLDKEQVALQWYKNGCDQHDLKGAEAFDKRHQCYEFIFNVENLQNAFDFLFDTNDEIYHICLYKFLIYELQENKKYLPAEVKELLAKLFSKTTQYLEDYLKEKAPHNLWKYQARHKNYRLAARLLLEIVKDKEDKNFKFVKISQIEKDGHKIIEERNDDDDDDDDDDNNKIPNLKRRSAYLLKIISFSRACGDFLLLNEAQWLYRLASIQIRYNEKVDENNTGSNDSKRKHYILDQQVLFNLCAERGFWDLILELFSFCAIETHNKDMSISRIWANYIFESLDKDRFETIRHRIVSLVNNVHNNPFLSGTGKGTRIEAENDILKPSIVLPLLEECKYNKKGPLMWACETLLLCGINPESLYEQYIKMINKKETIHGDGIMNNNTKADFIYIIAQLITKNMNKDNIDRWQIKLFNEGMEWFIENAVDVEYYIDCCSLISKIKDLL